MKPDLDGGPEITGYKLEYKVSTESTWTDFAHTGTAVTATITGLTANTSYQARVRAENGETDSDWSDASNAVSTNAAVALPTLSIADAAASEGSFVTFPVTLSAAAAENVTATCTASIETGDTAAAADLSTTPGTATINAGSTSGLCAIGTAQDSLDEEDETFTVTLSGVSSNATLGTATATGTIRDDDAPDDDFPADTTTTGEVDVGGSVTGNIETAQDADWFRVELEAVKTYQIDLEGADNGRGTLADPLLSLFDGSGSLLGNNDDGTVNLNSVLTYTATATGAHYLGASGAVGNTGTYTLSVRDITPQPDDDFPADTTTTGEVDVGGSVTGNIETAQDADWFKVVLEGGKFYQIDLTGGTNPDVYLLNMGDSSGSEIPGTGNDDIDSASSNYDSRAIVTPAAAGSYYLVASGATISDTGTYTLSVTELETRSEEGGTDFADDITTLGMVEVGGAATGEIDPTGDQDFFRVVLEYGKTYVFDLEGSATNSGTLANPRQALLDYSRKRQYKEDDDGGEGLNSRFEFTATYSGIHYLSARAAVSASSGGTYTLSVREVTPPPDEDLPADTSTSGVVEVNGSAARGDIYEPIREIRTWTTEDAEGETVEHSSTVYTLDTDWFAVELEADKTYRIDMKGKTAGNDFTLSLPQINAIYDKDGAYLYNTWSSDESSSHYLFRVTFHVHEDGTYYIAASGESFEWGSYKLSITTVTDDGSTPPAVTGEARSTPPPPKNVRAVEEAGGVRLTWEAPDGDTVTGYRIERLRPGEQGSDPQRSHGRSMEHHTLVEDTGSADTGYTDESAEKGVEYAYRVSARNESGTGEASDWVGAGPGTASNSPATGAPTIRGTAKVGQTLTAEVTGISDADGVSGETFAYQWVSSDGTADTDMENATGSTYKLVDADKGRYIKVRVTFTDDGGNEETLTSAATGPVLGLPGAPRNLTATPGNKEVTLSWDPPADNGNPPATRYRVEWRIDGKDYDKDHWGRARSTTYTTNDLANLANGVKYVFRVKAENGSGNSHGPYGPASEEVSATPTSGSAVDLGTPVLSEPEYLHHGMVRLDWQDIEDAGWYVVQHYHIDRGSGEWLDLPAEGVDIAFHGSSAVVSNLHGFSWLRVGAMSCAGASEWSQIEQLFGTDASDWKDVPVPEVEEGDVIEPCPVVLGTPVLSEPENLHHGMVQLDWEDIEDAGWYVVQYYHIDGGSGEWLDLPAEGVDIAFHGSSAVVSDLDYGIHWLRVGAASCAGESEWSQIEELIVNQASDWKGVPVPEVAEGDVIKPCDEDADTPDNSPATGAPTITGTAQVGETLTADTSGIADADGLGNVRYEYQWLADDADISGATNATYTLADADLGKAIKVQVSFTDDADNEETLTSAPTDTVSAVPTPNTPATGAPTISGTAQVGETLTANTSGIADADGLSNVSFTYQWMADDADISGATGSTYTLTDSEEGKAVKVQVSFTDDADNEETLTSAATGAVAAAPTPNTPATGDPTINGTAQVGETLTADTSGIADEDELSNVRYEYQWFADDAEIAGASGSTYTLTDSEEGKAIKVQVSFTDDADNDETLTSAATGAVAGAQPTEPPDKPRGLETTATHDSVTLTWDDPGDDSITGYVILRRIPGVDPQGHFNELVANTGTAATTYTDDTVSAETRYTYRIKAINGAGTSERSRWSHIDTPAAPVPDKPTGLEATASHDSVTLTWDDPGDDTITGYVILRRVRVNDTGGDFDVLVADTGTAALTYTDDTVTPGLTYTYRIKAINEHGTSERSRWYHIDIPEAP